MNNLNRIIMRHTVKQVVRMETGGNQVTIRQSRRPSIHVVSIGVQGPVGTVAESVLTMAQEAVATANQAIKKVDVVSQEQQAMVSDMAITLDFYIGAIAAQE